MMVDFITRWDAMMKVIVYRKNFKYYMCKKADWKEGNGASPRLCTILPETWRQFEHIQPRHEAQIYIKQMWREGNVYRSKDA